MAKPTTQPRSMTPTRTPNPAPKPASPVDIMNLMGQAADQKSRMAQNPEDEEDSLNSSAPKTNGKKSPTSTKGKQVAAMKEQEGKVGAQIPNKNV